MRSVSYVQRVALEFSGSLFPHAICLGDVDNDTLNELVVGDTSGKLSVYKNDDSRPWLTCSCQGMNLVVAVSAEGWFHLCDLTPAKSLDGSGHHETLGGEEQRPVFKQHIPANTKVMLISDIDGDGRCELVVGYTDRVVRAFRWEDVGDSAEHPSGQLVSLKKWMLEGQVDSLSVTPGPLGVPELMVSQPGCAYAILLCTWNKDPGAPPPSEGPMEGTRETPAARDVVLHQTSGRIHNKNVSTHLIGNIKRGHSPDSSASGLFALCTLDGTLKLMEEADRLLWSVQVDHQLFALEKLDVTVSGTWGRGQPPPRVPSVRPLSLHSQVCPPLRAPWRGLTPPRSEQHPCRRPLSEAPGPHCICCLAFFRATGMRRWSLVPGMGRRTSSTTTAPSSASRWMRTSAPSVQACMPAKTAATAPALCTSHSTRRSMCTGRCSWSGWSPPTCSKCWRPSRSSGSCWESWAWILMSCPPPVPCFTKPSTIQTTFHSAPPRAPRTPPSWTGFLAEQGAF
uniref:Integrin alpha FG-GAP repeat containing 2 n=1 Tax=Moschus moschiferus TaxID=68415 RepID=A0A8C6FPT2_MOSMO